MGPPVLPPDGFPRVHSAEAKFVLQGLSKAEARMAAAKLGMPNAQAQGVKTAIDRVTGNNAKITQDGANVVVQAFRKGSDGYEVIQTTVGVDGTKSVVQRAYNEAGNLAHLHPK